MRRLTATIWCDLRLQFRNGFMFAVAFVVLLYAAVWLRLPVLDMRRQLPVLVLGNLVMTTFYFVGGQVLLEKGEGTLEAQVVTPLRPTEYLLSKIVTLTLLAVIENVVIVALFSGGAWHVVPLLAGIGTGSAMFVLAGFAVVSRYTSINEYLLPSVVYTTLLTLPLLPYLGLGTPAMFYAHPLAAPLILLQAAVEPVTAWQLLYGLLYSTVAIALALMWSRRAFRRFIVGGGQP